MKVTLLKPDFGVRGGFEFLLDRVATGLRQRGFTVGATTFPAHEAPPYIRGLALPHRLWFEHPEYFSYLANVERVDTLRFADDTVVVATQPPTYLADHPRLVALTYHQARVFYDLAGPYVASGFIPEDRHAAATEVVHRLDRDRLRTDARWLAGSNEVAARLRADWDLAPSVFEARTEEAPDPRVAAAYDPAGPVVCVSRHAWPKRTEFVALAAVCDPDGRYELVGGGGRQGFVEALAAHVDGDAARAAAVGPDVSWLNRGDPVDLEPGRPPANLIVTGHTDRATVIDAFARASVVVAPAYREDYGLTVLEAFGFGRPVIVCDDGGGLVELVAGTGAGLIVDPTPEAIANAVRSLRDDPVRARGMAAAGLAAAEAHHRRDDLAVLADAIRRAGA